MSMIPPPVEPFRIKMVEPLGRTTRRERDKLIRAAGFNVFNLPAEKVFIDLLTDSGTSAMSDRQWAGIMMGDESYAGARSFFRFEKAVRDIFGFAHVIPTHQGRAAERILFESVLGRNSAVPSNIHFDTTRANIEVRNAKAVDLAGAAAYDPDADLPFKGDMDTAKLESFLDRSAGRVPIVMMTVTNNSGGGQPVSLANIRKVSAVCRLRKSRSSSTPAGSPKTPGLSSAGRRATEAGRSGTSPGRCFPTPMGRRMSAKKDALVNIGGFVTLNDSDLAARIKNMLIIGEGITRRYGGLAGRDLEAMAQGLQEVLDESYLEHRMRQVAYLGNLLDEAGVPYFKPAGGHAVYVLADRLLPAYPPGPLSRLGSDRGPLP